MSEPLPLSGPDPAQLGRRRPEIAPPAEIEG